jgi:DNA-binding transcriptional LysR family regulator
MGVDFDVALAAPVPTGIPAIEVTPLFDLPMMVVMRRDHALAQRNFLRVADLAGHRLIATAMGPGREDLERTFRAEGLEPRPLYTVSAVDLGCRLVLRTNAVILSDPTVLLGPEREDYAVVPLKPMRMIQVSMITQALKPESRLVRAFKACLLEEARSVEKRMSRLFRRPSGKRRTEAGQADIERKIAGRRS